MRVLAGKIGSVPCDGWCEDTLQDTTAIHVQACDDPEDEKYFGMGDNANLTLCLDCATTLVKKLQRMRKKIQTNDLKKSDFTR